MTTIQNTHRPNEYFQKYKRMWFILDRLVTESYSQALSHYCSTRRLLPVRPSLDNLEGLPSGKDPVLMPTKKLKIYPSNILQNPPYCTNLQRKKILGHALGTP